MPKKAFQEIKHEPSQEGARAHGIRGDRPGAKPKPVEPAPQAKFPVLPAWARTPDAKAPPPSRPRTSKAM
jgi:hypothetical protein